MKYKIENNIALLDNEAIDLIIAPDMEHDFDIKELLEDTSNLLVNAIIDDDEFHRDLIDCQRKMLKRFLKEKERQEVEKMLNIKAEDYGLEPNVTGFEESVNLAYLDGIDDAKYEDARNFLKEGVDEEIVSRATGLDLEIVRNLK
ncbi:hypothetical protein [Methanobrevibacter sp.]|uniref:hypothetical protein n=1 Tax=Methanobrevibacter sp. TaxID=66852 RepID=UPI0026DF970C|nr:hypothetical protein [Methanobrevibacter sp.]MDO5860216.1 hypothetical protein [Methanobrevibacter sp.]